MLLTEQQGGLTGQACGGAREGEDKSKFGVPGPKDSGDRAIGARMELSGACVAPRGRRRLSVALKLGQHTWTLYRVLATYWFMFCV